MLNTQPMNECNELQEKIPMDYTNTGLYRFIYGLYQYGIIWNIATISTITTTIHNTGINERVKRGYNTIYQQMKGQRQIISSYLNDHNLLNAEQDTTDETIPPYKTTSI